MSMGHIKHFCVCWNLIQQIHQQRKHWRIQRGAQQACAPLNLDDYVFLNPILYQNAFFLNKVQIAWESIKTTPELPGPFSGPWTPAGSEFGSALVMCVWAHTLLCPPPPPKWKSWIHPWQAQTRSHSLRTVMHIYN